MDVIKAIAILAVNLQNALGAAGERRDASLLMHVHSVLGLERGSRVFSPNPRFNPNPSPMR